MNVLIVEDEYGAARNLTDILKQVVPDIKICAITESIKETIEWFSQNPMPDLAFFDIHLSDGSVFEVFEKIEIDIPVIFTTAYDAYALDAFKVNSIDYLLKPINTQAVERAINKFNGLFSKQLRPTEQNIAQLIQTIKSLQPHNYKKTLLIQNRESLTPIAVDEIAWFYLINGIIEVITINNKKHTLLKSLERVERDLNPNDFFRVNRQYIVSRKAIVSAHIYFNRKLLLKVKPALKHQIIIGKHRTSEFKRWFEK